jgi:hypothetical protein
MKAISLYEPWATLIALGHKRFETRSWSTAYRGQLLICASKKRPPINKIIGILYRACITLDELNPGRAVAIVDLVTILKTDDIVIQGKSIDQNWPQKNELYFGDFSPGRYVWKFENVRRFVHPPIIPGHQGLFDVPDDLIRNLETYDPI